MEAKQQVEAEQHVEAEMPAVESEAASVLAEEGIRTQVRAQIEDPREADEIAQAPAAATATQPPPSPVAIAAAGLEAALEGTDLAQIDAALLTAHASRVSLELITRAVLHRATIVPTPPPPPAFGIVKDAIAAALAVGVAADIDVAVKAALDDGLARDDPLVQIAQEHLDMLHERE